MDQNYHKDHLACHNCEKKLIACRYILKEEHPHCIPCYQQLFANNCEECSKPIGPDYKRYIKFYLHHCMLLVNVYNAYLQCFTCTVCNQAISNKSFIPRDDKVVCVPCYEDNFAQRCAKCVKAINKGGVTYKNTPYHKDCFDCSNCNKLLSGEKFTSKEDKPFCADCYGDLFAKRCCQCSKPITGIGGTKFISFEERHWHSDCFNCAKCNGSMVGKGFLMSGQDILCPDCGRS
ncbi:hypothetical protein LOTGIDRAFT_229023 [Lottia gigantea]|uniref:LIM zinc-binding domain-containing protein n=1 Tax=Lottia gigantea TaxID=225164 RepID=V4A743_LOTGI|nr:hypothetical protein LOTGIDRAFT_229023 [Lottia gigantea]ESO89101.1 hypothetical protein LOTGIDRAFT_229023 [Lottia gigantea]